MAHKLESGVDRMVSTRRDTIWHRDETEADGRLLIIAPSDPESTVLEGAAYVWPDGADNDVVGTKPLVTADGTPIASHVATVSRTGRVLGVVGKDYNPIAFKYLMSEWILALARAGGNLETLGTFNGGRNFFGCMEVADAWRVPGDHSDTRGLLNVTGSHDGTGGLRASFQSFRVVCSNTDAMFADAHDAITDATEKARRAWVTVRHSANAEERIKDAVQWIIDGRARVESERQLMARLAAKSLSKQEVDAFVNQYINVPDDASNRVRSIRGNDRDAFVATLRDVQDLGNHALTGAGISAYGLLQAVTRFEDHVSRVNNVADVPVGTRRAFRAFLGERQTEKSAARDLIMSL